MAAGLPAGPWIAAIPAPPSAPSLSRYRHKDPLVGQSLRDGVACSVMQGCGETYFSAFALFLRASNQQIAWLAALPVLRGSLAQLASARLSAGHIRWRKRIIVTGAIIHALTWLSLQYPSHGAELFIACVLLLHVAGDFITPQQWGCLMGDLVPEQRRGRYFGHRSRLATQASFIALVAAGGVLHQAEQHGQTLPGYLLVLQCLGGLVWAGFSLSSGNYLYELLPGRRLASYMAFSAVLTAIGTGHWPARFPLPGRELSLDHALHGVFACSA